MTALNLKLKIALTRQGLIDRHFFFGKPSYCPKCAEKGSFIRMTLGFDMNITVSMRQIELCPQCFYIQDYTLEREEICPRK